jgi:dTDP-4-dehydrorhamnose reductase
MKVITLGNGFIASHLPYEIVKYRLTPNEEDMTAFIDEFKPDVVVNATGFCGRPNVDQCEVEKTKTYMSNVVLPSMLAEECLKRSVQLVHIGSGCIYFGESPRFLKPYASDRDYFPAKDTGWVETDFANPKSYYSKTKYACDLLLGQMPNVTTLRIRMPISTRNTERNFINKISGYKQLIDIPNSVTFLNDLVGCIDWVINNSKTGIYHVVNPQPLSAADVMREYQKYVPSHQFEVITEAQLDSMTVAKRSNCIINGDKLKNEGFEMTPSEIALKDCMAEYAKSI